MGATKEGKIQSLETHIDMLNECIEDMQDKINGLEEEKKRTTNKFGVFKRWLLENQKEENHFSKEGPMIVKLLRADDVLRKFEEAFK